MERKVLYIDSDQEGREAFVTAAEETTDDLTPLTAASIDEAKSMTEDEQVKVIISELELADGTFRDVVDMAAKQDSKPPCILMTRNPFEEVDTSVAGQAAAYVSKQGDTPYQEVVGQVESVLNNSSRIAYPEPEDEEKRIEAVKKYDIDALRDQEAFDRLAKIARHHFDVDIAFVGLILENTEEFIGIDGSNMDSLERECSICTFGIMDTDEQTVVKDTREDPRFQYIDALHDRNIVWYAGSPLVSEEGHAIGMFCIIDDKPREMAQEEHEILDLLAAEAMERIHLTTA